MREIIIIILIVYIIYLMEGPSENNSYTKLAAGAAAIFFPISLYQNYKNKKLEATVFKETEVGFIFDFIIKYLIMFSQSKEVFP